MSIDSETKKAKKNTYQNVNRSHEPRSRFIKRVLMYSAFAVLTIILSVLVFYRARGYTFTKNGQVEKRGIVLIDSAPVSAQIFIDDKDIGKKTDRKLEISEGDHTLRLEAEGYKTWQTSFSIKSEQVEWFYYPYLIAETLNTSVVEQDLPVKTYSSLNLDEEIVAASKVGAGQSQTFNFQLLQLKDSSPTKSARTVVVPSQIFSRESDGNLGEISFSSWSPDGNSIYLEHRLSSKKEIINLKLGSPEQSSNLTTSVGAGVSEFSYDESSRLYLLNSGEYAIYNPNTLVKESVIDTGVLTARNFADDKYVYAKNPVNPGETGIDVYVKEKQNISQKVSNIKSGTPADLDFQYTTNRRIDYLSISNTANKELLIYREPLESEERLEPLFLSTFSSLKSGSILSSLPGSPQPGSFIALQLSSNSMFIYNFEDESSLTYELKDLDIASVSWIDSHRLQLKTADNNIYYVDYNGNYLNQITKTDQPFSFFIRDQDKTVIINSAQEGKQTISQIKFKI